MNKQSYASPLTRGLAPATAPQPSMPLTGHPFASGFFVMGTLAAPFQLPLWACSRLKLTGVLA